MRIECSVLGFRVVVKQGIDHVMLWFVGAIIAIPKGVITINIFEAYSASSNMISLCK
jgi:hypothetical protein